MCNGTQDERRGHRNVSLSSAALLISRWRARVARKNWDERLEMKSLLSYDFPMFCRTKKLRNQILENMWLMSLRWFARMRLDSFSMRKCNQIFLTMKISIYHSKISTLEKLHKKKIFKSTFCCLISKRISKESLNYHSRHRLSWKLCFRTFQNC